MHPTIVEAKSSAVKSLKLSGRKWLGSCWRSDEGWRRHHAANPGGQTIISAGFVQNLILDLCFLWFMISANLILSKSDSMRTLKQDLCKTWFTICAETQQLAGPAFCRVLAHNDPASAWRDYRDPIMATLTMTTYIPRHKKGIKSSLCWFIQDN